MQRRYFLKAMAAASLALLLPAEAFAADFIGYKVFIRCLGDQPGPRYLDGRTHNGSVGLVATTKPPFTGTKWQVFNGGNGTVALKCLGELDGPRWLDGRTQNGTVGLAPTTKRPYTGTRWTIARFDDDNPNIVALRCEGALKGPRWLDGRTQNGSVGLAPTTEAPYTGTRWEISYVPVRID